MVTLNQPPQHVAHINDYQANDDEVHGAIEARLEQSQLPEQAIFTGQHEEQAHEQDPGKQRTSLLDSAPTGRTPPARRDRVSGARKPAKLETGLVVQVPLFVDNGERIKVDTRTGEYLSRA